MKIAAETGATPYDIPGVELGHHGEQCSFDAFIAKYELDRSGAGQAGAHRACRRHQHSGTGKGGRRLAGDFQGAVAQLQDDHEMLKHGMVIYDALYAWCADTPMKKVARLLGLK